MPINDRNLKAGTKLVARYHKQNYSCEVVENLDGKLLYQLEDGRMFKSPSGAGMAITGHACDGWAFWSVETAEAAPAPETPQAEAPAQPSQETAQAAETAATTPAETGTSQPEDPATIAKEVLDRIAEPMTGTKSAPAAEEPGPAKKRIFRLPNQKGVPQGKVRWYCHDCGKSFLTDPGENPQTCPEGHKVS